MRIAALYVTKNTVKSFVQSGSVQKEAQRRHLFRHASTLEQFEPCMAAMGFDLFPKKPVRMKSVLAQGQRKLTPVEIKNVGRCLGLREELT